MKRINKFLYSLAYLGLLGIPALIMTYLISGDLNGKALVLVLLAAFIVGGIFDIWATRQGKKDKFFVWEYNSNSILGIKICGVPTRILFFSLF